MSKSKPPAKSQRTAPPEERRSVGLELRRTPLQARGQATFDRILAITAELLEEFGAEAVTTNLIAKAAGINVATLYQYFPNKQAVLLSLFERQSNERVAACASKLAQVVEAESWRVPVHAAIDAMMVVRRAQKGVLALRQVMRADPELKPFERAHAADASRDLTESLVRVAGLPRTEADLIARCCVEAMGAILDLWLLDTNGRDDRVIRQAKLMIESYLAPYFDQPVERSPRLQKRA